MKFHLSLFILLCASFFLSETKANTNNIMENFNYTVDRFADVEVLRYKVEGFENLSLRQKIYIYYLSLAAEEGRDILFDQNNKYNLAIRKTLEAIYLHSKSEHTSNDFKNLEIYLKRVWFSNGIHHHYGMEKFIPEFSEKFFRNEVAQLPETLLPKKENQTTADFINEITEVIFNPNSYSKRVNQQEGDDLITTSANNYYEGVTQKEAESFYDLMRNENDPRPISYGLNSTLIKKDGKITEEVWKLGGKYSKEIERIIFWLEKAKNYTENDQQKKVIEKLISFYQTGDLKTFDDYSIAWIQDTVSQIDFVNGFIETYGDPLGIKASWESIVNFKNLEATKRTEIISENAQWFEDNSPVDKRFKKKQVKGVTAKVITAAMLGGDCYPPTPIGINLPNANWIRQVYGSKSVTIENITDAYDKAAMHSGFSEEFVYSNEELLRKQKYSNIADNLHTDLHECLGHGSGQMLPGINQEMLKAYGATIEEARADLFGLYYIADSKIIELGLLPNEDAYKAHYYQYLMNGLMTQLVRINPGAKIEESHMRNRALISRWVYEKGTSENVVEFVKKEGKTYVKINDYTKLRSLFGDLLKEIQRIKSEGDYTAAKNLVETYGVNIDKNLHKEVLLRYQKLNLTPYKGFINPKYIPVTNENGEITDVRVFYGETFTEQSLRYGQRK